MDLHHLLLQGKLLARPEWCPEGESDPHAFRPMDFESRSSAIPTPGLWFANQYYVALYTIARAFHVVPPLYTTYYQMNVRILRDYSQFVHGESWRISSMSSVSSSLFASTCASHSATNRHTFRNERAPQKWFTSHLHAGTCRCYPSA